MNLSVKEGKRLGKRGRGSSGWVSHSVIVLQPLCVGHPDCPVLQEGRGKALLSQSHWFVMWSRRKALPWVMSWKQIHTFILCLGFCDLNCMQHPPVFRQTLARTVLIHLWSEKPREGNMVARRPISAALWARSNRMTLPAAFSSVALGGSMIFIQRNDKSDLL